MNEYDGGARVVMRHRVSLAGHVLRSEGGRASGGFVQISSVASAPMPAAKRDAQRTTAAAAAVLPVTIGTPIRGDGSYFFMDLPAGDYVTGGLDERGWALEAKTVSVPVADRSKKPTLPAVDVLVAAMPVSAAKRRPAGPH